MAFRAIRLTQEATAGTYPASPPGSSVALIRLDTNDFEAQPVPEFWEVRDPASTNRLVQTGSAKMTTTGKLSTLYYFSQAKLLPQWAINITGSPLAPPTFTVDSMWMIEDGAGTLNYRRYLGCYCRRYSLRASNQGDGVKFRQSFEFVYLAVATITSTDFPTPALTAYPTDQPVVFQQSSGGLTLSSARSSYSDLAIDVENIFDVIYDESRYPQAIRWFGRNVSMSTNFRYKAATDRTNYESVASQTASVVLTDGTNATTFDFKTKGIISTVADQLPLGGAARQQIGFKSLVDATAGTDVTVATTP